MIDTTALYMHPVSGDVQLGGDWIADSIDWYGDIPAQLATLIEVQPIAGQWVEA